MLKIEKKLIDFVEKHMLLLMLLLVSLLALYIRRIPIWWNAEDVVAFYDIHDNGTQSYLFHLLVRAVQFLPLLPIHSIKWISVLGDFAVAVLCAWMVRETAKTNAVKWTFSYVMCIFSPVLILRGVSWAQIDSVAVALFLMGWILAERKKNAGAAVLLLFSAVLYPCMMIFAAVLLWTMAKEKDTKSRILLFNVPVIWLLCCGLTAIPVLSDVPAGQAFLSGLESSVAWVIYNPVTGRTFATGLEAISEIVIVLGLPVSVIGGIILLKRGKGKLACPAVMIIHFLITVLYGTRMFE